MDSGVLIRGMLVGASIAAPVGPIGVLCIRRSLLGGRAAGFASGLGAATADAAYGAIAALGLTSIAAFLVGHQSWLRLGGGAFLLLLGYRSIMQKPVLGAVGDLEIGWWSAYASTLVLTITNPMTILSFAAVFAGLGLVNLQRGYATGGMLVLGVFIGSALWWALLSTLTSLLRSRLDVPMLRLVNRISGGAILGYGLASVASVIW
jgi:threonine/homoserine/homoserine lactone efflux protein